MAIADKLKSKETGNSEKPPPPTAKTTTSSTSKSASNKVSGIIEKIVKSNQAPPLPKKPSKTFKSPARNVKSKHPVFDSTFVPLNKVKRDTRGVNDTLNDKYHYYDNVEDSNVKVKHISSNPSKADIDKIALKRRREAMEQARKPQGSTKDAIKQKAVVNEKIVKQKFVKEKVKEPEYDYEYFSDGSSDMEAGFNDLAHEEARSSKIARREDEEEERKERERLKKKRTLVY